MAAESGPEWLRNEAKNSDDSVPLKKNVEDGSASVLPAAVAAVLPPLPDGYKISVVIQWTLRIATMMICTLMAATSLIGLSTVTGVDQSGRIFVAVYMFFFAALLFVFEGVQIRSMEALDHVFRRNFGFLYNVMGKSFFIIFVGFLAFGLGKPESLSFCTGLIFAGFGAGELALYLKYPEFFE